MASVAHRLLRLPFAVNLRMAANNGCRRRAHSIAALNSSNKNQGYRSMATSSALLDEDTRVRRSSSSSTRKKRPVPVMDTETEIKRTRKRNVPPPSESESESEYELDDEFDDELEDDGYQTKRPKKKVILKAPASVKTPNTVPEAPVDGGDEFKSTAMSHLSESRFDQYKLSPLSIRALHQILHYEKMTFVQEATLPVILEGKDVLAKAKTGTGKTIAFLLPAIEKIAVSERRIQHQSCINVLVVCPTRELAMQAAAEATTLVKFHTGIGAQVAIGGTNMATESKKMKTQNCQILVATPGRLLDHIQNTHGFMDQLSSLKVLVLDEADTLLDMGFRKSIADILKAMPKKRQTLLFSATIPSEVHNVSKIALKEDHKFIDTVGEDEETHVKVTQHYLVAKQESQLPVMYSLLKAHVAEDPNYKVLVFCTTANITAFMAGVFQALGFSVREIHSRKSQSYRTKVSDEFRKSKGGLIMFTSDVSARGVDYPNVTLVLQIGVPAGREQYIHRLGRTGRAGKTGQGVLMLMPWEEGFVRKLSDLSLVKMEAPEVTAAVEAKVKKSLYDIEEDQRTKAYQSWLGYYTTAKTCPLDKRAVVENAKRFSASIGCSKPPVLQRSTLKKMGLADVL